MAESEEVLELRRRARRRLIGATALVLFLVIVPPWLMDLEPRPVSSNLSVEIPGKDAPKLDARAIPVPPVIKPPDVPGKGQGAGGTERPPEAKVVPVEPPHPEAEKAAKKAEKAVAATKPAATAPEVRPEPGGKSATDGDRAAAILKNEVFFFQLGAFNNRDNAKVTQQKAVGAGVKATLEVVEVKGVEQTRVFAGPFPTREAAEKARIRIKEVGLEPGPTRAR